MEIEGLSLDAQIYVSYRSINDICALLTCFSYQSLLMSLEKKVREQANEILCLKFEMTKMTMAENHPQQAAPRGIDPDATIVQSSHLQRRYAEATIIFDEEDIM